MLAKQHSEPPIDKRSTRADELRLTPLELIDRIAALVPPPRTHRNRYFRVLASNSPLSAVVTAMAQAAPTQATTVQAQPAVTEAGAPSAASLGLAAAPKPEAAQPKRAAHRLEAVLIALVNMELHLNASLCTCLHILSVSVVEKTEDSRAVQADDTAIELPTSANHLNLFDTQRDSSNAHDRPQVAVTIGRNGQSRSTVIPTGCPAGRLLALRVAANGSSRPASGPGEVKCSRRGRLSAGAISGLG